MSGCGSITLYPDGKVTVPGGISCGTIDGGSWTKEGKFIIIKIENKEDGKCDFTSQMASPEGRDNYIKKCENEFMAQYGKLETTVKRIYKLSLMDNGEINVLGSGIDSSPVPGKGVIKYDYSNSFKCMGPIPDHVRKK